MSPAEYGIVGTIMTVLDIEYLFLSNGARQSLAKEMSLDRFAIPDVIVKTALFQFILIAVFFSVNFFGAPLLSQIFHDPSLDFYFRVASFLVPANGLFVLLLGINDGLHLFTTGALLSTLYPICKLSVIPLVIYPFANDPVLGMEVGYLLALVVSISLGLLLLFLEREQIGNGGDGTRIPFSIVVRNTLSFSIFFIMVSLVLSMDTLIVKAVVSPASMAGYYTGAVNLGKIPYYLVSAFCTIILPVVSKLVGVGDRVSAVSRVQEFLLLIFAFILPIPVIISASSAALLSSFYQPDYAIASTALRFLAFSSLFMGLTVLFNMVYAPFASDHFSDILSVISLAVVIPGFIFAARHGGITAIAAVSACATAITMMVSFAMMTRRMHSTILTKSHLGAVAVNALLWVVTAMVFAHIMSVGAGLLAVAAVDGALYIAAVGSLLLLGVVHLPTGLLQGHRHSES